MNAQVTSLRVVALRRNANERFAYTGRQAASPSRPVATVPKGTSRCVGATTVPGFENSDAISSRRVAAARGGCASVEAGQSGCASCAGCRNASAEIVSRRPFDETRTI
jgi:hypothetical protein